MQGLQWGTVAVGREGPCHFGSEKPFLVIIPPPFVAATPATRPAAMTLQRVKDLCFLHFWKRTLPCAAAATAGATAAGAGPLAAEGLTQVPGSAMPSSAALLRMQGSCSRRMVLGRCTTFCVGAGAAECCK